MMRTAARQNLARCVLLTLILAVVTVAAGTTPSSAEAAPTFILTWGVPGSGEGQFDYPFGVAVDTRGDVYVTDTENDRVQKFTSSGDFITQWGTRGTGPGQFKGPWGLATDTAGNVYVTDTSNRRVQKFTSTGDFITQWGTYGTGPGQFKFPRGVAVGGAGEVYVTDVSNRVQKFTSSGDFITQWGTSGTGAGQFNEPRAVGVDVAGNVYVADFTDRVQKFTSSGTFLLQWGTHGSGDGQFDDPYGLAVDRGSNVYVADSGNGRVQRFTSSGALRTQWGTTGRGIGQFLIPAAVAVDTAGNIYVADSNNHRIQKFVGGSEPPPALQLSVSVRDYELVSDPWRWANVRIRAVATREDGSRAGGVQFVRVRGGQRTAFGPRSTGSISLLEGVNVSGSQDATIVAKQDGLTARSLVNLYQLVALRTCDLDGRPEPLNALRNLLSLVGVPPTRTVFDGFLQAVGLLSDALPNRYRTELNGYEVRGENLTPMYLLEIEVVDTRTGAVDSSRLFSRRAALLDPLYGRDLVPLQRWARNNRCHAGVA